MLISITVTDPLIQKFFEAAEHGNIKGVADMINNGLSVDTIDEKGYTALMWAAYKGANKLIDLLLEKKADINKQDQGGLTALHWAAFKGFTSIAKSLLQAGASRNIEDKKGHTPLELARKYNKEKVARLLDHEQH